MQNECGSSGSKILQCSYIVFRQDIYTEANICNARTYSMLEVYIQRIQSYIMAQDIQLPAGGIDLVLDLRPKGDDEYDCGYYLANHETRCLFWLDNHDAGRILEEVKVPYSLSHVGESHAGCNALVS
jgi:hypothetical protein